MHDKTINATIFFSSQAVYNSLELWFGDGSNQTIDILDQLERKKSYFGIPFNFNDSNSLAANTGPFILSSAEARFDSNLIGFEINAALSGNLNISILINQNTCKSSLSCANYFNEYERMVGFQNLWSAILPVKEGFNRIYLGKKVKMPKYSILYVNTQGSSARLFVEKNSRAFYGDYELSGSNLKRLDLFENWRIQLNALIEEEYYDYSFNIIHQYDLVNIYNLTFNFSNGIFSYAFDTSYRILNSNFN